MSRSEWVGDKKCLKVGEAVMRRNRQTEREEEIVTV